MLALTQAMLPDELGEVTVNSVQALFLGQVLLAVAKCGDEPGAMSIKTDQVFATVAGLTVAKTEPAKPATDKPQAWFN